MASSPRLLLPQETIRRDAARAEAEVAAGTRDPVTRLPYDRLLSTERSDKDDKDGKDGKGGAEEAGEGGGSASRPARVRVSTGGSGWRNKALRRQQSKCVPRFSRAQSRTPPHARRL